MEVRSASLGSAPQTATKYWQMLNGRAELRDGIARRGSVHTGWLHGDHTPAREERLVLRRLDTPSSCLLPLSHRKTPSLGMHCIGSVLSVSRTSSCYQDPDYLQQHRSHVQCLSETDLRSRFVRAALSRSSRGRRGTLASNTIQKAAPTFRVNLTSLSDRLRVHRLATRLHTLRSISKTPLA